MGPAAADGASSNRSRGLTRPAQQCRCGSRSGLTRLSSVRGSVGRQGVAAAWPVCKFHDQSYLSLRYPRTYGRFRSGLAQNSDQSKVYERFQTGDQTSPDTLTHLVPEGFLRLTALPWPVAGPVVEVRTAYTTHHDPPVQLSRRLFAKSYTFRRGRPDDDVVLVSSATLASGRACPAQ